jgi:carboxyl-terminal processing protease
VKFAVRVLGISAVLLALFSFGFSWRDIQGGRAPSIDSIRALVGLSPGQASVSSSRVFRAAYDDLRTHYALAVDEQKLKYAALSGMVASLGDPHTQFLDPRTTQEFAIETRARFAGVGARLAPDPLGARVAVVFDDGPANRAGLKKEDLIVGVNGKSVTGMNIDDIVKQIRGKEGTVVTLQVQREGHTQPLTFRIERAQVVAPTVEGKMLPGTAIGYIAISLFSEPTGDQFERKLAELESAGMKGLVVDVRGNPGGLLDSAVDVLSVFLSDRIAVKMRGRDDGEEVARTASGRNRSARYPIVTLINEESASAAEIFAGVMRDYKMTTIVGEHSYGKASVQNVIPMVDGASIKVTIAKYFLPSGQDISRKVDEDGQYVSGGIAPDVEAELNWKESPVQGEPSSDSQLRAAIEVIRKKLGLSAMLSVQTSIAPGVETHEAA